MTKEFSGSPPNRWSPTTSSRGSMPMATILFAAQERRQKLGVHLSLRHRQHEVGLGKAGKDRVTLAQARAKAAEGRKLLDATPKIDPRTVWRAKPTEKAMTFGETADALLIRQDERLTRRQEPETPRPMAQIARRPAEMVPQYAGRRDRARRGVQGA